MKYTDAPYGVIKGATDRFLAALGDDADMVTTRINIDPDFVTRLAVFAASTAKKLLQVLYSFETKEIKKFVASQKFVQGRTIDGVSIGSFDSEFMLGFLDKIEKNVKVVKLKVHKLLVAAIDLPREREELAIIPELAGKHGMMLAHFFQLLALKQQKKDYTPIRAYVRWKDGTIASAVSVHWDPSGWRLRAYPINLDRRWDAGNQVASL